MIPEGNAIKKEMVVCFNSGGEMCVSLILGLSTSLNKLQESITQNLTPNEVNVFLTLSFSTHK